MHRALPLRASRAIAVLAMLAMAGPRPAAAAAPLACGSAFTAVSSPSPPSTGSDNSFLGGLAAIAPDDVWAVGSNGTLAARQTLREHWDGTAWTIVPGPDGAGPVNWLVAAAAVATGDVWAVGYSETGSSTAVTLIEHWDGASWIVVPSPNLATRLATRLYGVAAASSRDVWAVGEAESFSDSVTVAMHWDGASWSIVPTPNVAATGFNRLAAVESVASSDLWAVGWFDDGLQQTLIERWDGSSWSVVPSPNVGPFVNYLIDVEAVAANDVWAAGWHLLASSVSQTSLLHWDGTAWSVVPAPNVNQNRNWLYALAAVCSDDVYAAGFYDTLRTHETLIEHWDGTSWCIAPAIPGGPEGAELYGAAVVPGDGAVWVAGGQFDLLGESTFTARAPGGTAAPGVIGNHLLAAKRGPDVALDWSGGPLTPRSYNVHREGARTAIAPPSSPPLAPVTGAEAYADAGAVPALPPLAFYEVYGRDCAGRSIFN